jgi:hypothetical protein
MSDRIFLPEFIEFAANKKSLLAKTGFPALVALICLISLM